MERTGEVGRLLESIQKRLDDHDERFEKHEERIEELEKENVGTKKDLSHVVEKVDRIDANITWLVRLITGAVVTGIVGGVITAFVKFVL